MTDSKIMGFDIKSPFTPEEVEIAESALRMQATSGGFRLEGRREEQMDGKLRVTYDAIKEGERWTGKW